MASTIRDLSPDIETLVLHETQKALYVVPQDQLRAQLIEARSRLQPKTYGKVSTVHIMWDEPQSKHLEAGCHALADVFSEYGYMTEQVRLGPTKDIYDLRRTIWGLLRKLKSRHDENDMIIIHYRGRTEYAEDHHGAAGLYLRSSSSRAIKTPVEATGQPGLVDFTGICQDLRGYGGYAQVVYLMDSDYSSRASRYGNVMHPLYGCDPVLAAVSGAPEYGPGPEPNGFTDSLVKHFREALRNNSFYSLSTLLCAMYADGLRPFATRASFGRWLNSKSGRVSQCFVPVLPVSDNTNGVSMIAPTQALGTILVKVRIASGNAEEDAEHMSNLAATLDQWLSADFFLSAEDGSCTAKLAELAKAQDHPDCVYLEMSRALWHCMTPYRGWVEVIDGSEQAEGDCVYYGKDSPRVITALAFPHWDSVSESEPDSDEYDSSEDM